MNFTNNSTCQRKHNPKCKNVPKLLLLCIMSAKSHDSWGREPKRCAWRKKESNGQICCTIIWLILLITRLTSTKFLELDNAEKKSSKPRETKFKLVVTNSWSLYIVHALQTMIFLLFGTKTWKIFGGFFFSVNLMNFAKNKYWNFFPKFFLLKKSDCKFGHYVHLSVVQQN